MNYLHVTVPVNLCVTSVTPFLKALSTRLKVQLAVHPSTGEQTLDRRSMLGLSQQTGELRPYIGSHDQQVRLLSISVQLQASAAKSSTQDQILTSIILFCEYHFFLDAHSANIGFTHHPPLAQVRSFGFEYYGSRPLERLKLNAQFCRSRDGQQILFKLIAAD